MCPTHAAASQILPLCCSSLRPHAHAMPKVSMLHGDDTSCCQVLAAESAKLEAEQELQRERTKAQDAESSLHELQNQLDAAHKEQQPATAAAAKGIAAGGSRMIASLTRQVAEYAKQFKQGRLAVSHAEEKVALITQQLTASTNEFKASQLALQTANGQIMQLNTEIAKVKVALSAEQDTLLKIKDSLLQAEHDRDQLAADNDQLHSAVDELNKTIATSESASVVVSQPPGEHQPGLGMAGTLSEPSMAFRLAWSAVEQNFLGAPGSGS